jgi:hypothetical protein
LGWLDRFGELIESCRQAWVFVSCFDAEFVVTASQVLDEGMPDDHDRRGAIGLQAAYWSQSGFKSTMVALYAVVRILLGVVQHVGHQLIDDSKQWCSEIGGDLTRSPVGNQCALKEPCGRWDVSPFRDIDVDGLAVLVHSAVDVTPDTGNFDMGFVNEPLIANAVTTWSSSVDEKRREALYPSVDGDVVDFVAAFG